MSTPSSIWTSSKMGVDSFFLCGWLFPCCGAAISIGSINKTQNPGKGVRCFLSTSIFFMLLFGFTMFEYGGIYVSILLYKLFVSTILGVECCNGGDFWKEAPCLILFPGCFLGNLFRVIGEISGNRNACGCIVRAAPNHSHQHKKKKKNLGSDDLDDDEIEGDGIIFSGDGASSGSNNGHEFNSRNLPATVYGNVMRDSLGQDEGQNYSALEREAPLGKARGKKRLSDDLGQSMTLGRASEPGTRISGSSRVMKDDLLSERDASRASREISPRLSAPTSEKLAPPTSEKLVSTAAEPVAPASAAPPASVVEEPAVAEPAPASAKPASVVEVPAPASAKPASVVEAPAPASAKPASVVEAPAPASAKPASVVEEPAPASAKPASVVEEAAPAAAPAAEEPAPADEEPAPAEAPAAE